MALLYRIAALLAVLAPLLVSPVNAQAPERRFALVIGNSEYKAGRLPTAANDAGLIAETLRTAGFDVVGARDLDQDTLRRSIREFLDKVSAAGPQAVTFVYIAGYGLQFEGENYIVPIDASIRRGEDIPIEAIRISDFTRPLAGTPGAVKMIVVDAARQHPFTPEGPPLASGLALVEPDPGTLVAFNATPGSIAAIENGPYGAYAQALAEMIGTGGLGLDDLFARLRLRVNEKTNGVAVPWYASKITQPFLFMERTPDAPPPPQVASTMELQSRPIREFRGDQEAYVAALERDTLSGYEEFVAAFPDSPLSGRVRALIAVRREAITWRRTVSINTPEAYWSYLERYPRGAHVADAQRRLARLAAAYDPPPSFAPMAFADVEPPPPDEVMYLSQPAVVFDGPGFLPPPPVPAFFLPPPAPEFVVLPPPPPPIGAFFLPVPVVPFISGPRPWVRPPAFVQAPPRAPIQQITINNTTITNQRQGGGAAALSAPSLPTTLVSRANSGALKAPPTGGTTPTPIKASVGATVLTNTAATNAGGQLQGPGSPGRTGTTANTAVTTPGGQLQGPGSSGRTGTTANTAVTTPGGQLQGPGSPGRTGTTANTAVTTPGGQLQRPGSPGRTGTTANTAVTTPGGQLQGPGSFGNTHPTRGPNTATSIIGVPSGSGQQGRTPTTPPAPHVNAPVASPPSPPPPRVPQVVNRAPPPPPVAHAPPPPPVVHAPPPPPVAHTPPPPPPPVAHVTPPAQAARPAQPSPAAKRCVVENGKQVCR